MKAEVEPLQGWPQYTTAPLFPFSGLFIFVALFTEELGTFPNSVTLGGPMTGFGQCNVVEVIAQQFCLWAVSPLLLHRLGLGAELGLTSYMGERHMGRSQTSQSPQLRAS